MFRRQQRRSKMSLPVVEDLSKELVPVFGRNVFAVVIHNVLKADECESMINRAEEVGFDQALINNNGRQVLNQDVRSCQRCMIDDEVVADALYQRIINALQGTDLEKKVKTAPWLNQGEGEPIEAVGLNERLRFLKYGQGNFFGPHKDIRYVRGIECGDRAGETSHVTVQLYLNDKFKGGTTRFLAGKRYLDVKPRAGSVLIFDHELLHEGSEVTSGRKYSVRSDIMYSARGFAEPHRTQSR